MVICDSGPSGLEFKRDELKCKSKTEIPPTERLDNSSINPLKFLKWTSKAWRFPKIKWILFHSSFWLTTSVMKSSVFGRAPNWDLCGICTKDWESAGSWRVHTTTSRAFKSSLWSWLEIEFAPQPKGTFQMVSKWVLSDLFLNEYSVARWNSKMLNRIIYCKTFKSKFGLLKMITYLIFSIYLFTY